MIAIILYGLGGVLLWEYISQLIQVNWNRRILSPTIILNYLAEILRKFFLQLGRFCAYVSSFYIHLKLEILASAGYDLLKSICNCLMSVFEFFKGYVDVVVRYTNGHLIWLGSGTIIIGLLGGLYWWLRESLEHFETYVEGFSPTTKVLVLFFTVFLCFYIPHRLHRYYKIKILRSHRVESEQTDGVPSS